MAKYGNYGWSPRQMERINERRAKRGQEELRNRRYEDEPEEERQRPSVRPTPSPATSPSPSPALSPAPTPVEYSEESPSMAAEAFQRTGEFRKKFKPAGSMAAQYGYKSSFPVKKDSSINSAYKRL